MSGNQIPLEARVLAVADAFDAMTSSRPYRSSLSQEESLAELRRCAGSQFDADVVEALVWVIRKGGLISQVSERQEVADEAI